MKKLIITGSTGMLGSNFAAFARDKFNLYGLDIEAANPHISQQIKIDLTDSQQVSKVIEQIKPDYIVHCAAMTNVDLCETEPERAKLINTQATENLVRATGQDVKFVYISTGSVFDGEKGGYSENDTPSPVNVYARTKLEGEWAVERRQSNYTIIRTDIIGWNLVRGCSFIEWVFNNLSQGNSIKMFTDVIFTPITVNTLSENILEILEKGFTGRVNIGVTAPISKYDFGIRFADRMGFDRSLIQSSVLSDCLLKAQRPKNTSLNTRLAQRFFGKAWTIDDEILRIVKIKEPET